MTGALVDVCAAAPPPHALVITLVIGALAVLGVAVAVRLCRPS